MASGWAEDDWDAQPETVTKPLTKQEAAALIEAKPQVGIAQVLRVQVVVALLVALLLYVLVGKNAAASLVYGALVVLVPSALFARGIKSRFAKQSAMNATLAFFLWEGFKLAVTIVMLALAVKIAANFGFGMQWPYLLLGMVVTMKAVWIALWWHRRALKKNETQR